MSATIFLDLDGVLVDFVSGALRVCGRTPECLTPGEWDIFRSMGLTKEEFYARIEAHGSDF